MSNKPTDTTKRKRLSKQARALQILDIAEKLFIEVGYEAATLEDVARIAGVTRPVVYEHYGSKEGLFLACATRARQSFEQDLAQAIENTQYQDVALLVTHGGDVFFRLLQSNPQRWILLFGATLADSGLLAEGLANLRNHTIARITSLMLARVPAHFSPATVEACAYMLSGVGEQLGRWWLQHPEMTRDAVVDLYKGFILGGLNAVIFNGETR